MSSLTANGNFCLNLRGQNGRQNRFKILEEGGTFRGEASSLPPSQKDIVNTMMQIRRERGNPVTAKAYYASFNQLIQQTARGHFPEADAEALMAAFGLRIASMEADDTVFGRHLALSKTVDLSQPDFKVLEQMAKACRSRLNFESANLHVLHELPVDAQGQRAPIRVVPEYDAVTTLRIKSPIYLSIRCPSWFSGPCQVLVLERDTTGAVSCLAPSYFIRQGSNVLGDGQTQLYLPEPKQNDPLALDTPGRSVILAVLLRGEAFTPPTSWHGAENVPEDCQHTLAPLVLTLAGRDPGDWLILRREIQLIDADGFAA